MSGWGLGGWFGGSASAKKKDAPKEAILGLRSTLEMLTKREKHLENEINNQDGLARKYVNTNKTAARSALRRKKQKEHELSQTQDQMMTLEREIASIETANINKETMTAMQNASKALKVIHGGLTVDKVDQTMEDLREQHAIGEEIAEALTQGAVGTGIDEDELEEELEGLQQEELDNKMLKTGNVPVGDRIDRERDQMSRLPGVPAHKGRQAVEEDDEEEELRKLQAEMAM